MKVAIIGLDQVGKTTLFGALTRQPVKLDSYGQESSLAVVEAPARVNCRYRSVGVSSAQR
jgi:ribosome-binding ATPase YchF (GTP1/OBG family)